MRDRWRKELVGYSIAVTESRDNNIIQHKEIVKIIIIFLAVWALIKTPQVPKCVII